MSRLRGIKGKEAIKAFVKAGGIERKGKGDHVNIKMPNGQIITIPSSKELKIGLLKAAIKKSRLNGRGILEVVKIGGKEMEYTILVYKAEEGGFWAEVPALPGCYSQGETIEETMENAKEAIEAHLLALKEEREEVPTEEEFVIGRVKVGVSAVA